MTSFRYTFGRSPVARQQGAGVADASSNVNLDWLLQLNRNLADDTPDTQRFREIIGADSIGSVELLKWLGQAQAGTDALHCRAYQDLVVCLGRLLGYQIQYGHYEQGPGAPFMFSGLWHSDRVDLGLLVYHDRLETLDVEAFKRGYDEFFRSYSIPAEKFTCLLVLGQGCSRKIEGLVAPWLAAGRARLITRETLEELVGMVESSLLGSEELDSLLGSGRLMYVDELVGYVDRFLAARPEGGAPAVRPVAPAPAPAPAPAAPARPTPVSRPAPQPAPAPEPEPMPEPEPEPEPEPTPQPEPEPEPVPEPEPEPPVMVVDEPAPARRREVESFLDSGSDFVVEEEPVAVVVTDVVEPPPSASRPPARPASRPSPRPAPPVEDEPLEVVADTDPLAAIRGRVAAIAGEDEVVVVVDAAEEVSSVGARLAALDAVAPTSRPAGPPPTPAQPTPPPRSAPSVAKQRSAALDTTPPGGGGDVAADIVALEKVVEHNPTNMPAHVQLGKLYARTGQFEKAIEAIKKVINEESDHIQANLVLGEIHYRKGEYPKAALSYDVVLNKDANNVEALVSLGKVYLSQEKFSRALKVLQQAQGAAPGPDAEIELQIAKVFYVQEKLDQALVHMQRAREIDPKNVNVYLALGHYHLDTKNPTEAKKAFEEGLKLDPNNIKLQTYVNNLQ